ncbi:nucleotidyltransferase family protein [Halomonas sp. Bachu 37]|uniref:N-acetylmuramate alpha-1-phosphate uridylyltransferase MurU n=1 Tax=Halomonas kashgarensis TaxID=3084920 RepID=UPI0032178992
MKAMILAAGLGKRMRPLTDHCPKPLLPVAGKPLLVHHLERLARAGITEVVINVSYRAEQIIQALGDGTRYGVHITWSREAQPLETGGGMRQALTYLGEAPFYLVNGDVWCDTLPLPMALQQDELAHLSLVDNPSHHPHGDFHLDPHGKLSVTGEPKLTYAGIALVDPGLVADEPHGAFALAPLLKRAMTEGRVSGSHYSGHWVDVGTPQRLQELEAHLAGETFS